MLRSKNENGVYGFHFSITLIKICCLFCKCDRYDMDTCGCAKKFQSFQLISAHSRAFQIFKVNTYQ